MKKILFAMFTLAAVISLSVSNLYAFPVLGFVDPGFSDGYVLNTTTSGTATYYFKNLTTVDFGSMTNLRLRFEADVFDLDNTYALDGTQTSGWSISSTPLQIIDSGGNTVFEIELFTNSSGGLPTGQTFSFDVKYELWGNALALDPLWDEGGYWNQKWTADYDNGLDDGGSTAPIPEPGTMMMLGISILTLAGYGKMRLKK